MSCWHFTCVSYTHTHTCMRKEKKKMRVKLEWWKNKQSKIIIFSLVSRGSNKRCAHTKQSRQCHSRVSLLQLSLFTVALASDDFRLKGHKFHLCQRATCANTYTCSFRCIDGDGDLVVVFYCMNLAVCVCVCVQASGMKNCCSIELFNLTQTQAHTQLSVH